MSGTGVSGPRLGVRVAARARGWVRTEVVEAYRRAGNQVYEDVIAADATRQELLLAGNDLRTVDPGVRTQLVCTWNAFALQTLGTAFLEAAPAAAARLPGYLPRATVGQAELFLAEVGYWSGQAQRGGVDAGYDIGALRPLPAPLPPWFEAMPCPREHVTAMLDAGAALRDRAEAAMTDFHRGMPTDAARDAATLAGLAADAEAALAYAGGMFSPDASQPVHEALEESVRRAVESLYRLGQFMAAPALLDRPTPAPWTPDAWAQAAPPPPERPPRRRGGC